MERDTLRTDMNDMFEKLTETYRGREPNYMQPKKVIHRGTYRLQLPGALLVEQSLQLSNGGNLQEESISDFHA